MFLRTLFAVWNGNVFSPGSALDLQLAYHVSQHAREQEAEQNVYFDGHSEVVGIRVTEEEPQETPEVQVGKGSFSVVWEHQTIKSCDLRPPYGVSHSPDAGYDEVHSLELGRGLPQEEDDADGDVGDGGEHQHRHLGDALDQRAHQQGHDGPAHPESTRSRSPRGAHPTSTRCRPAREKANIRTLTHDCNLKLTILFHSEWTKLT
ncbi:uncharacterized protein CEXT_593861 [Caerostris extrusa]|uniref:Uncharacterized protein n=1 Tax=Caerostris extrusa TaxID=172846 RepID=A0AAV4Q9F2_CAEEX|nr:uncharacterized protein CEXT_593861 [Caerostris extrusa]